LTNFTNSVVHRMNILSKAVAVFANCHSLEIQLIKIVNVH
jgi:hypothetical protein